MQVFSTEVSLDSLQYEEFLERINEINLELRETYLWYHTKLNIECLYQGNRADDGIMGRVLGVIIDTYNGMTAKLRVPVEYTALHPAELFNIRPITGLNDLGNLELLGFSVFPK